MLGVVLQDTFIFSGDVSENLKLSTDINKEDLEIKAKVAKNNTTNAKLAIQELDTNKWVVPFVIEPSAGVERAFLAILNEAYSLEELDDGKTRVLLSLKPHLALSLFYFEGT